MIKEEYKNLPDTEFVPLREGIDPVFWGKYEINKLGEIKTLESGIITKTYYNRHNKIPVKSFRVGKIKKSYPIHRLVALTFLVQEKEKPEVDHINRNTLDFRLSNLRFVSRQENLKNRSTSQVNKYIIYQKYNDTWELIEEIPYSKISAASRNYINKSIINKVKAYNFYWKRVDKELDNYLIKHNIDLSKEVFISIPNDPQNRKISKSGIILEYGWIYSIGWADLGGYRKISIKEHPVFIHRLVYELFSGDTDKLTEKDYIDHLDTDPQNNNLRNLKRVNQKENMNNHITVNKLSKPVLKYSLNGEFLEEFPSLTKACESMGLDRENNCIRLCCEGKLSKSHGYVWKFKTAI